LRWRIFFAKVFETEKRGILIEFAFFSQKIVKKDSCKREEQKRDF